MPLLEREAPLLRAVVAGRKCTRRDAPEEPGRRIPPWLRRMTADELDAIVDSALHDLGLDEDAEVRVSPDAWGDLWSIEIEGVSLTRNAISLWIRPDEYPDPNRLVAAIRTEIRKTLCPICQGRCIATVHTEGGQQFAATDIDCKQCGRPFVMSWPLALGIRSAWENGSREVLDKQRARHHT